MNIPKAIEILEDALNGSSDYSSDPLYQASELGKEALKRLLELRRMKYVTDFTSLPGETKD